MAEYATPMIPQAKDYNTNIHVGWYTGAEPTQYSDLFKDETVTYIQQSCSNYLMPLFNKPIVIPAEQVREMITSVWNVEAGGDRAGIYTDATFNLPENKIGYDFKRIVQIVIQSITSQISTTREMQVCNDKLNIWNTVLGDFNEAGIRAHPKIKLRERHPAYMQFFENY